MDMSWVVMTGFLVPLVLGCCLVSAEDRDRINETRADKERIFYLSAIFEKYSNNGEISLANVKKLMVNLGLPPATDKMAFDIEGEEKENDTHCHDIGMGCKLLPSDLESSNKMLTKRSLSADHGHFHHNKVWFTSYKVYLMVNNNYLL